MGLALAHRKGLGSFEKSSIRDIGILYTVNSRLADTSLLPTLAFTDKIQIPVCRGLTENDSRYYKLSLFRTQNDVPKVYAIKQELIVHTLTCKIVLKLFDSSPFLLPSMHLFMPVMPA